jgi:hypothetical protein
MNSSNEEKRNESDPKTWFSENTSQDEESEDQTVGGGRTKLVMTGRKATKVSLAVCAMATGLAVGSKLTDAAAGPMLGAEQIEQEWCEVCESAAGCAWTACAVPIANTSAMHNTPKAWVKKLRFAGVWLMPCGGSSLMQR